MHDLHQHLTQTLAERLKHRRVVTWYDPRREFTGYVGELLGGSLPDQCRLDTVEVGGLAAQLCVMQDSFFEVKFAVESHTAGGLPDPLLIYLPGRTREDTTAVLMELEAGGERWEPQLKREARRVLKHHYGDGQIDQMLVSENVDYKYIVSLVENRPSGASLLSVFFSDARGDNTNILADWLADPAHDQQILDKSADDELRKLIDSRLGLELSADAAIDDARQKTLRYVLLGEFRHDLDGQPPPAVNMIAKPATKDHLEMVLDVATAIRKRHPHQYILRADQIEQEFSLASQGIAPERLGKIDTFRFEEQLLLQYAGKLIVDGEFAKAIQVVQERRRSFWAEHYLNRQEQWRVCELAAQLGDAIQSVRGQLPDHTTGVEQWVQGYCGENGWHRVDLLHRRLESAHAAMTEDIESEQVLHRVRKDYDRLIAKMTTYFIAAFGKADWSIPGFLRQVEVYSKKVASTSETVCYFLVDALRFEMGVELKGLLEDSDELTLEPAIAAIPTITPVGMAALMPGAESSFSVVEKSGKLAGKIEGAVVADMNARRKVWKGQIPGLVDLELDKTLSLSTSNLKKRIADATLVLVRSVEIDAMGESGNTLLARQVLDTAIGNVARAIKRLAGLGIARFVVAADHGHLFALERDESQRIEKPGGDQVDLHRRCWAGRGGSNPPATVRISASQLGYDSDLDFVFPTNNSVFKAGGDLAYYHGGLSLQELLVPVLTVRMPVKREMPEAGMTFTLTNVPMQIANRVISFGLSVDRGLLAQEDVVVRPALLSEGSQVGHAGMVLDAELDTLTHCVRMQDDKSCTIGMQLLREDVDTVDIVILDPSSDRILAQSKNIPVNLGTK